MTAAEIAYRSTTATDEFDERNELVMKELPQVYYIAARIRERLPQHVEMEDLVNAGVLGLIEATRNFDSAKNAGFSTARDARSRPRSRRWPQSSAGSRRTRRLRRT
jgi:RNA polymerase sigma factor for flagellar operon FliA